MIVNGHPDPRPERFCAALCAAYAHGALHGGWQVRRLDIGLLPSAMLESFSRGFFEDPDAALLRADFAWANRIALVYPLWFERPPQGVVSVFSYLHNAGIGGQSACKAHVIVTMDMPAFALRSQIRPGAALPAVLDVPGLVPDEPVLIGCMSTSPREQREQWLQTVTDYGERSNLGSTVMPSRLETLAAMIDRTVSHWLA